MSGSREIVGQIKSIKNTRKVTSALEMVSASKIRKAQDRMEASRPYARMMRQVIGHLAHANPEYRHPFTVEREEIKRVAYIVMATDRGLCGGLNNTLFRKLLGEFRQWQEKGVEVTMVLVGRKAAQFFRRVQIEISAATQDLGEQPRLEDLIGSIKVVLDGYREEEVDRVYLCYNRFINTMTQKSVVEPVLPLPPAEDEPMLQYWDYLYEPDAEQLLDDVLTRYVESLIYQAALENVASEHAARMVAMKSASDNASDLIDDLQLAYNKARQAAITQEISEIVGGAAAV
ncbi:MULTISPECIES: F0F1 ATP synthase subunit gamma [unclassified Wenzhouxiangella]|uniref:F0F1 ATP synthase subunit gamma n=1 Tax=unclassified Wenzhouxiangella TaxID=2613841 RepID=UPI000E3293A8|nr:MULTISPECIES: F0F1 ATP synthase subunit gamma [unclassified Wenzhouxiangella]RFF26260.1 F0F1 ATP synthase subunit gamma [Wenzhouxiangella sp. 15181]RFP68256.1 F0F1 ATP synthase subunit gamma [Wenzhouxiangella sp. 15190]